MLSADVCPGRTTTVSVSRPRRSAFPPTTRSRRLGYQREDHRLYFRRLSQTTQTDVLLGNLDGSDGGRVFLRPMSVQQRIKELNLRARMFADTMMAIQTPSNKHSLNGPRSLQVDIIFVYIARLHYCVPGIADHVLLYDLGVALEFAKNHEPGGRWTHIGKSIH